MLSVVPNVTHLAAPGTATEVTIKWNVAANAGDEPIPIRDLKPLNQFEVVSRRRLAADFVRERAPQLSTERLVVITVDISGREVAWQQVPDPRIVRAETPGPSLELSGQTLYRPVTELVVTLLDALSPAAIRVYEVQWNGTEFVLHELGQVAVGA